MRFLSDESVEFSLTRTLRDLGHDVTAVGVEFPSGIADTEVITIAQQERRILVTNDTDFGELTIPALKPMDSNLSIGLSACEEANCATYSR